MSHCVSIPTEINDIAALQLACKELGLTFMHGQKTYEWYGRSVGDDPLPPGFTAEMLGHCEHAIKVPGATYEIGVCRNPSGKGYTLLYDFYEWQGHGGHAIKELLGGEKLPKLVDLYGVHKTTRWAVSKGYQTRRVTAKNGKLTLQISAP